MMNTAGYVWAERGEERERENENEKETGLSQDERSGRRGSLLDDW